MMERVAFIDEQTQQRITCMLNPEHIVHRRTAGLAPRRSGNGVLAGPAVSDAPLMRTGGGRTELELSLLFDVDLLPRPPTPPLRPAPAPDSGTAGASTSQAGATAAPSAPSPPPPRRDVRELTRPLWDLAENPADGHGVHAVRFVLGKAWNMLAVVEAIAERLENIDPSGTPGRSWITLRLVRVPDPNPPAPLETSSSRIPGPEAAARAAGTPLALHSVIGVGPDPSGDDDGPAPGGETVADIAAQHFDGDCSLWRWIADVNQLVDVVWPAPGTDLLIPPAPDALPRETP